MSAAQETIDATSNTLSVTINSTRNVAAESIKNKSKPSYISDDIWTKNMAMASEGFLADTDTVGNTFTNIGYATVGIDISYGIYHDYTNGYSAPHMVYDAEVDTTLDLSNILISTEIGAAVGSICPGPGNIIGAGVGLATGLFITFMTDYWKPCGGKTIRQSIKDQYR